MKNGIEKTDVLVNSQRRYADFFLKNFCSYLEALRDKTVENQNRKLEITVLPPPARMQLQRCAGALHWSAREF